MIKNCSYAGPDSGLQFFDEKAQSVLIHDKKVHLNEE